VIRDEVRCAFGLGWECKRRGDPPDSNPFDPAHWKSEHFLDGYRSFRTPSDPKGGKKPTDASVGRLSPLTRYTA